MFYRRKQSRLRGVDYSRDRYYFVTACVKDKICCLGYVHDGKMYINSYGQIVQEQWNWLGSHYPYVELKAFVVMPNHVHGIIRINRKKAGKCNIPSAKVKPLTELIGAFKSTSSTRIRRNGLPGFTWQRSFHDHIIRTGNAYKQIFDYIRTNPLSWAKDRFCEGLFE